MDSWKSTQVLWKLYGTNTDLSEAERSLQLMQRCNEELLIQILQVDPNVVDKSELEQLRLIRSLAVVPAETLNRPWEGGELAQTPLAKGRGKAAACKPGVRYVKKCCREAKEFMNLANHTLTNVANVENVGNGESVGNVETPRDVLGWSINEGLQKDAVIFIEHKELTRENSVSETVFVKVGHWEQQVVSPAVEAKLREGSK